MARISLPDKPLGYSKGSFFRLKVWEFLFGGKFPMKGQGGTVVEWESASGTYFIKSPPAGAGATSISFVLYDPTKSCTAGTVYKIRSTDAAAVTGIDIGGGVTVNATPGKFYCLKSTPANPTEAKYIPTLPDGSGETDPENEDKHWEFITPATVCAGGTAVEV